VLLGPIISRFFACSNEEKQQRVHALVLSLWFFGIKNSTSLTVWQNKPASVLVIFFREMASLPKVNLPKSQADVK
jgi:hypothetical protein